MRIGFDAKRATHNFRGLGNYSRGLIEGLLKYYPSEELLLYSPPVQNIRGSEWLNSLPKKAIIKTPHTFLESKMPSLWRSFSIAPDLKKDNLDIFHGLSHEIPYGLKGKLPFKKIVTMHDLIYLRYPQFFPLLDRVVYNQKFKYAAKNSDLVIAICEQTKLDLIELLGVNEQKIKVHYQSCSPIFYQLFESSALDKVKMKYNLKKPFILNVGAFEERKNQLTLLLAYAQIEALVEEDLVFVGQGKKYKEQVISKAKDLNLSHRVHFLDSVPFQDLPAIYQSSKLFCFPSLFEGFGIPIVEALFSKIPVITSKGSCFPESAGADSIFIDPLSESSIANAIRNVLSSEELQKSMITNGFLYSQRFHLQESTKQLLDIYHQVLS
ncbi:MAG: glycosyltransferase family 1 protein [Bacteriovorax sp.]|nr:glycosyltransferase family 1 protein [Bacteriovorax sp.]